jgi:hypothetical protein
VTMYEIFTLGGLPYSTFSDSAVEHQLLKGIDIMTTKPDVMWPNAWTWIKNCMKIDAEERPLFSSVVHLLSPKQISGSSIVVRKIEEKEIETTRSSEDGYYQNLSGYSSMALVNSSEGVTDANFYANLPQIVDSDSTQPYSS